MDPGWNAEPFEDFGGAPNPSVFLAAAATGPEVVATTLEPATAAEVVPALRLTGDALSRAMEKGELLAFNDPKMRVLMDGVLPWLPRRGVLEVTKRSMQRSD